MKLPKLQFDFNAFAALDEKHEINILESISEDASEAESTLSKLFKKPQKLKYLIWAGLLHEKDYGPEELTDLLKGMSLTEIIETVTNALMCDMGMKSDESESSKA